MCDQWFAREERFTLPMRIAVTSTLPDQYQPTGFAPDDTITLTLPDETDQWISTLDGTPATITVDGTYYAGSASSFVISDTPPADATVLGTSSVTVTLPTSGRDPVTIPAPAGFTIPTSQYGTWVWRVDRDHQTEAATPLIAASVSDQYGQPGETHVTQMQLTLTSTVTDQFVTEPVGTSTAQVCDQIWVEHSNPQDLWLNQWGTNAPIEVSVTGKLYHSAVPGPQTLTPSGVPIVDQYELTFTAAGKQHAQTVCHPIQYGEYGAYGFQFSIDPGNQPPATRDYLSHKAVSPLWLPEETVMVQRTPSIHTTATQWDTTTNGVTTTYFQDDIWQLDWPDAPVDTDMHGAIQHGAWAGYGPWQGDETTLTVDLWRIQGAVTPDSCTPDNPAATLVASNTVTPAINTWAAAQKVSGSRFTASGGDATYTFVVTWPGDTRTRPYQSLCGEPSETLTLISQKPEFVTHVLTQADAETSTIEAAQAQETGTTVEPGASLVDVLHTWTPDTNARPASMTGWHATWHAYHQPLEDDTHPGEIITDPSGILVYSDATCTPDTLYWETDQPIAVDHTGTFTSPAFTAPDQAGSLYLVETITDTSHPDQPATVRRGICGAVSESAIIPASPVEPAPQIATQAPSNATVGDTIHDTATLTGPYPQGTIIQFWSQHTDYIDPDMPQDQLQCVTPHPHDMTRATLVGETILDHPVPDGHIETITSPGFTSDQTGCTHIKEIALTPPDEVGEQESIAEGWFGQTTETTHWHQPTPTAKTGGTVSPPNAPGFWTITCAVGITSIGITIGLTAHQRRRKKR